ncbi:MAG TPA: hypothetical protein VMG31_07975 [Verrucomicrobiae bacterium]|nr:hypothetical protein [Verrucomicrobiae bacterium]
MKTRSIAAAGVMALLLASFHIAAPGALAQQAAANPSPNAEPVPDARAVIEKIFGSTRQVEVRDPFYNNLVAFTIVVPKDWVFEGTVLHGPGCSGMVYQSIALRATSPDAAIGVQIAPRLDFYYWEEQNARPMGQACKFFAPMSSADYAAMFAYRTRPNPQIDRNEPTLDIQQAHQFFERKNEQMAQSASQWRMPAEYDSIDFSRTRLHYDWEGFHEEEWMRVEMVYKEMPKSVFIYNGGPHPGHQAWTRFLAVTTNVYTRRAPSGKLDQYDPGLNAILNSMQLNPDFVQATNNHQQQITNNIIHSIQQQTAINQQQSQAFMDAMTRQHEAFMASQNRQFQISQQNAADQMNRQTQQAHNFIAQMDQSTARTRDYQDILLDQQYYANPQTGETSTVSGRFTHTWVNGPATSNATTVVQSPNANFNPNGAAGYDWVELMPIHH